MKQNKLEVMEMRKLVWNMALPLMISLLVQSMYNIVDSIFVAQVSQNALTAVSLVFPVQLLMIAVGVGTGVGVNALLAQSIGAKKYDRTTNIANTGVLLACGASAVFLLGGLFLSDWFVSLFTSDPLIAQDGQSYLRICMVCSTGSLLATMFQRFLQSTGDSFDSMLSLSAGALTNLILDPVCIFGLGFVPAMGVQGAAAATVIGQWVSAILAIFLNAKHNPMVKVSWKGYRIQKEIVKRIYQVGLPTIVTQALGSIMVSLINKILILYSPTAVAFFGVYYKLQSFLFMPMNGLGQAAIPIAGFNAGARHYERIREMLKIMIVRSFVISIAISVVFLLVPQGLLSLFQASGEMLQMGVPALRIISLTFPLASITIILGYTVSGLGNGILNMTATALRQVVILVPCVWMMGQIWGVQAVWYAFWISETIALIYAVLHTRFVLKQKGILS